MKHIVMVCTGNTCRSPMAEALMRRALQDLSVVGVGVESAGVFATPGDPASAEALLEMRRRGLSIEAHRARPVLDARLEDALVLCMTESHRQQLRRLMPGLQTHTLLGYAGLPGEIQDPIGRGQQAYKQTADQIWRAVQIIAQAQAQKG